MTIDSEAMEPCVYGERDHLFRSESGKACPMEILEALAAFNAEGRPIWKPMHMQTIYRTNPFGHSRGEWQRAYKCLHKGIWNRCWSRYF